jgi:3',5'-cyclic AMP phosphodiesterase CpdA
MTYDRAARQGSSRERIRASGSRSCAKVLRIASPAVTARILHLSDPHIGRGEDLAPLLAVRELGAELRAELLLATGDLTHRGRPEQLQRAHEIVHGLELPFLAVPGNHDIPYTFPARFTRTFEQWEIAFGETEPTHVSDAVVVVGLNSVRPWRQQGGALRDEQLASVAERLDGAPAGAYRIVTLHHHLAAPPWPAKRKKPVRDRDGVLKALVDAGAELVACGHVHQAALAERREFEVVENGSRRSLVLTTAPGIGRPRPYRRGEARGVNFYEIDPETLSVTTLMWNGDEFVEVAQRTFPRR